MLTLLYLLRIPALPEDTNKRNHTRLIQKPHTVPAKHLVGSPFARDVLDGLLRDCAEFGDGCQVFLAGLVALAAFVGEIEENWAVEDDTEVLVSPFHYATGGVD